jgi:threonine dehydrogenase-like Zn-dependent dehydrogenase
MRSLTYLAPGEVEWREAPSPTLEGDREALVQPIAASRCDFDRDIVRGESPFQGPFAIGHEGVARVIEVGDAVKNVSVGDSAVVVFHVSCGQCERCRRGLTAHCLKTPPAASYGMPGGGLWGGLFDDLIRVPFADAMLTPLPDEIDPIDAVAAGDSLGLAQLVISRNRSEDGGLGRVAVLGRGEHGLYQAAIAIGRGAQAVLHIDSDAERREIAEHLGALVSPGPPDQADGPFDLVIDAAASEAWLRRAVRMLEPGAMVECLGGYFGDLRLPGFVLYSSGVNFRFGVGDNGPHVRPTLEAIAAGVVDPSKLWAAEVPWDELPTAYVEEERKLISRRPAG